MESSIPVVESDEATAQLLLRALTFAGFDVAAVTCSNRAAWLSYYLTKSFDAAELMARVRV